MELQFKLDWSTLSTVKVSRGYTYDYKYLKSPEKAKDATIVLLHGFPEEPEVFDDLAFHLNSVCHYDVLIPALLGYKGTSKPTDPEEYNFEGQVSDILDICKHEGISSILPMGRDWGAPLSSRFPLYAPEITKGCVIMCVQYLPPSELPRDEMDLDRFIKWARQQYGVDYDNYNYFKYFTTDESNEVMDAEPRKVFYVLTHQLFEALAFDGTAMRDWFRSFALPDEPMSAVEEGFVAKWKAAGWRGPLNWYKAMCRGKHRAHEEKHPWFAKGMINVPTLYIGGAKDKACPPAGMEKQSEHIADLKNVVLEKSGHALNIDDPEGVRNAIQTWLQEKGF